MSRENPTWGVPHIRSQLALLGYDLAESTVAKYRVKPAEPPSQTWRTFLANHLNQTAAVDFFTVPTATFRILYGMVVMRHERRHVVHFNVTEHPTAEWAARQIREAFPFDETYRFLIHDNDSIFTAAAFQDCLKSLGIESVKTAWQSPWQNPYCERLIGSIRRDCLDHVIVLGERHLKRILASYFTTTTAPAPTCPSPATRRSLARSNRPTSARWSPSRTLAACTTATPAAQRHEGSIGLEPRVISGWGQGHGPLHGLNYGQCGVRK
jgi:putative transposase